MKRGELGWYERWARCAVLASALGCCTGCYAAVGPTIGVAHDGRATLGWEASAATFTVAASYPLASHPLAHGATTPATTARDWTSRTYVLWEPGYGAPLGDRTDAFLFASGGASLGVYWDRIAPDQTRSGFAGGAWVAGGRILRSGHCGGGDARPYVVLVLGFRAGDFYLAPKGGLGYVPSDGCPQ